MTINMKKISIRRKYIVLKKLKSIQFKILFQNRVSIAEIVKLSRVKKRRKKDVNTRSARGPTSLTKALCLRSSQVRLDDHEHRVRHFSALNIQNFISLSFTPNRRQLV